MWTIREPGPDDADGMAQVQYQGWRDTYAHLLPSDFFDHSTLDQARERFRTALAAAPSSGARRLVAVQDATVIGIASAGPAREHTSAIPGEEGTPIPAVRPRELFMFYVLKAHHGSGVATELMARSVPEPDAQLWVAEDNPRAQAFYRKSGFTPDGARDMCFDVMPEIRMVRGAPQSG